MTKEKKPNQIIGILATLESVGVLYVLSFAAIMILLFLLAVLLGAMGIDAQCGDNHIGSYPSFCKVWDYIGIFLFVLTGLILWLVYHKTGKERFLITIWQKVFPWVTGIFIFVILATYLLMKYVR